MANINPIMYLIQTEESLKAGEFEEFDTEQLKALRETVRNAYGSVGRNNRGGIETPFQKIMSGLAKLEGATVERHSCELGLANVVAEAFDPDIQNRVYLFRVISQLDSGELASYSSEKLSELTKEVTAAYSRLSPNVRKQYNNHFVELLDGLKGLEFSSANEIDVPVEDRPSCEYSIDALAARFIPVGHTCKSPTRAESYAATTIQVIKPKR